MGVNRVNISDLTSASIILALSMPNHDVITKILRESTICDIFSQPYHSAIRDSIYGCASTVREVNPPMLIISILFAVKIELVDNAPIVSDRSANAVGGVCHRYDAKYDDKRQHH